MTGPLEPSATAPAVIAKRGAIVTISAAATTMSIARLTRSPATQAFRHADERQVGRTCPSRTARDEVVGISEDERADICARRQSGPACAVPQPLTSREKSSRPRRSASEELRRAAGHPAGPPLPPAPVGGPGCPNSSQCVRVKARTRSAPPDASPSRARRKAPSVRVHRHAVGWRRLANCPAGNTLRNQQLIVFLISHCVHARFRHRTSSYASKGGSSATNLSSVTAQAPK